MFSMDQYVKPNSLEEAYALLQEKGACILGGMHWLKMQDCPIHTAIDLKGLSLNHIKESKDSIEIGCECTLRELETNRLLNECTNHAFLKCLENIVGVPFRNTATVGGTVALRAGYSDLITVLLSLDANLLFYHAGKVSLNDFLKKENFAGGFKDILLSVFIPNKKVAVSYQALRNSATDLPVLNVSVCRDEEALSVAVGARPALAEVIHLMLPEKIDESVVARMSEEAADAFVYGDNMRGSKEYRKHLANVFIKRAIEEVLHGCND